jgi:hypothetical protein
LLARWNFQSRRATIGMIRADAMIQAIIPGTYYTRREVSIRVQV